jgi:hypothetical protein
MLPTARRQLGRCLAALALAGAVVVLAPPVALMPRWLTGLGTPAAAAQIPCPDVPGVKQACQVATAIPDGAINAVGDAASAGIGAGVRAIFDGMTHWVVAGAKELVSQLSGWLDSSTRPDVASGWFSDSYAAMVKVGLAFVLPSMKERGRVKGLSLLFWTAGQTCGVVLLVARRAGSGGGVNMERPQRSEDERP